jgi:16S rRNA (guanine966-N2)-methyltransferase
MSNPRIIAGKARGRVLKGVPGDITRPITDRVKEALFNIIGHDIYDACLLDLFGGTGSVGIEALSRGAKFVRFIDIHNAALLAIRQNLEMTGFSDSAEVTQSDAFRYLLQSPDKKFDYIFIAPPQYHGLWKKAIFLLDEKFQWLSEDAWVIVQIDPSEYEEIRLINLREFDQRKYGSTLLCFFDHADQFPK